MIGRSRPHFEIHNQNFLSSDINSNCFAKRILATRRKPAKLVSKSDHATTWMEMEQSLEEAQQQPAANALEFDSDLRKEADHGSHQIRTIRDQLSKTPEGLLGRADLAHAQFVRENIRRSATSVISSFTKILSMLDGYSSRNEGINRHGSGGSSGGAAGSERRSDRSWSSSPKVDENSPPHSPSRGRSVGHSESPGNTALSESPISHGSPPHRVSSPLSLDTDAETANASGHPRPGAGESSSGSGQDPSDQPTDSKRRKFPVPSKVCIKQRGTGTESGGDGPPEDGFTWRKYGQKDILGSNYPKSYYRCTRKHDMNCPARKQVQRSDEDPTMFDVTYLGTHTCEPTRHFPSWPFSMSPEVFARILAVTHRPSLGELNLPEIRARGGDGSSSLGLAAEAIQELSPISALLQQPASITSNLPDLLFDSPPPLSTEASTSSSIQMTNPVKAEGSISSRQRVSSGLDDAPSTFGMFINECTSSIASSTSTPFSSFSSALSEGFSSQPAINTMSMPATDSTTAAAAGRTANPNPQGQGQSIWAGLPSVSISKWGENLPQSIEFRQSLQQSSQDPQGGLYRFSSSYPSLSDAEYSHLIDPLREGGQLILPLGEAESPTSFGGPIFDTMDYVP